MNKRDNIIKWTIISIFVSLYGMVSVISTIHVIDFFRMSNPEWLAITLAIAFEVGAAASLGAIVILNKTSKALVWMLFILITGMQVMGNMYYAYTHLENFKGWIELFGLNEEELVYQKRILSLVSGAILPIVALGFIKSLVDYIRPNEEISKVTDQITDAVTQIAEPNENIIDTNRIWDNVNRLRDEGKLTAPDEGEDEASALANSEYRNEDINEVIDGWTDPELTDVVDQISESLEKSEEPHTTKDVERRIAKVIANNPDLKAKLSEEIKKLENEDKYTNPIESNIANDNIVKRTFGGM
jgi:hypothetical protein